MFGARFDDAVQSRSLMAVQPLREIVARDLSEVRDAIGLVSQEARDGKWVAGYVSYESAPAFDSSLKVKETSRTPLLWFGVFGDVVEVDPPTLDPMATGRFTVSDWTSEMDEYSYSTAYDRIRDHLREGDSYQVNLTFPMRAAFSGEASALYANLLAAQEPSYAAHLWHGDRHVLSVSPERFFSVEGRNIRCQPMKGTIQRGRWGSEDMELRATLAASEKDRTENLMIVDLVRNDLGRICEFGSVNVNDMFAIQKFRTVWQMTSDVTGTTRRDVELADVFDALFPCGSVTGAPKARSMEIIRDVEPDPRGVYCGAIGFLPPGDGLDGATFNVAIRTAVIDESEGMATYGVGGGITWDSTPSQEFAEALVKARVLTERPSEFGLIESIRWDGAYVLLDAHVDRLEESALYWEIPCDILEIRAMLAELESSLKGPTKVRLELTKTSDVSISMSETTESFATRPGPARETLTLCIDREPLSASDALLFHKVKDRRHFDVRRKRHADSDDVLCVNEHGRVTESTIANVAFLVDGRWYTPPVSDGLLPGVLRAVLIDDGLLVERSFSIEETHGAEAVALINSVRGWTPAVVTQCMHHD